MLASQNVVGAPLIIFLALLSLIAIVGLTTRDPARRTFALQVLYLLWPFRRGTSLPGETRTELPAPVTPAARGLPGATAADEDDPVDDDAPLLEDGRRDDELA